MREIKFRAWIKNKKKMVYGKDATCSAHFTDSFKYRKNEVELMQYTGLKDENNKEIYEGDIIKGTYYDNLYKTEKEVICQVRWDKSGYWTFSGTINFLGGYLSDLRNQIVIGNIYENPELLKENGQ